VQVRSSGKERLIRVTIEVNPGMEAWARADLAGKRRSCTRLWGRRDVG